MKGLIIKDLLNLRNSLKTSLLILMVFSFMAYKSQDPKYLVAVFVLIISMQSISSMAYDEMVKWDIYALTMPLSRRKLVLSKYILSILLSVTALIISAAISYIFILPTSSMSTTEFLLSSYLIFAVSILFLSVLFPLVYKYGVEKSRLLIFVVISIPILIGIFLNQLGIGLPNDNQFMKLVKISPVIIIIVLYISSLISCRVFKAEDL